MEVVVPLRRQPESTSLASGDETRVVEIGLGDDRQGPPERGGQCVDLARELLEQVSRGVVDELVNSVEAEAIDVVIAQPGEAVVDDEAANLVGVAAVEIDRGAPRRRVMIGEVRPEALQVVSARTQVVVDDVDDHAETVSVAGIDESLEAVRTTVRLVYGEPADAVVAPAVRTVESRYRHHLDQVDSEVNEVIEPGDRSIERAGRRERADVHLVDDAAGQVHAAPAVVGPAEAAMVIYPAGRMHAVR